MKIRHQKIFKKSLLSIFQTIKADDVNSDKENQLIHLSDLVNIFRPSNSKSAEKISIYPLIQFLKENKEDTIFFKSFLSDLLKGKSFKNIFADAGILQNVHFRKEIKHRIMSSLIPFQPKKDTLEYILNQVFYLHKDIYWIEKIPIEELYELYDLLELKSIYQNIEDKSPLAELLNSIRLTMQRMSGRALESDVIKMLPEYENLESPFEALEKEFDEVEQKIRNNAIHILQEEDIDFKHLNILLKQCDDFVDKAFGNSSKFGISLNVNQSLLRIRQQIERIKILIPFLTAKNEADKKSNSIQIGILLIKYNCLKNNIKKLFNESTQLLAYEITQHSAKTGEHYITKSSTEYFKMFYSAMGGGIIVGILCIIKLLLSKVSASDFGHAMLYSANYAVGFIAIFLLGFTLATKQPAMTAAALIQSIEKGKGEKDVFVKYKAFAELFARLFRSQFIAFVGNVLFAFPISLLGIYLIDITFDYNIAATKWPKLLTDISPAHSPAIFHAAIAGVFLFLSGIISGSVANSNKHNQLYYRIEEHPILKISLGKKRTTKIAHWFEYKWAGVVSNFWFGIFMGSTASIGIFIGLDLDIRHITFASGNLALGLYGTDFNITNELLFWGIFGIGIIGFVNFIVSFMLSLTLALRSRSIPFRELKFLFMAVLIQFRMRPLLFFFPLKDQ